MLYDLMNRTDAQTLYGIWFTNLDNLQDIPDIPDRLEEQHPVHGQSKRSLPTQIDGVSYGGDTVADATNCTFNFEFNTCDF